MKLLSRLGLCAESTLRHPHKGFAEATLSVGGKELLRIQLCKNHALGAARMIKQLGGDTVVVP